MSENILLQMIRHLRQTEEVVLYGKLDNINPEHERKVISFLTVEYEYEKLNFPFEAPPFDEQAAFWSAKTFYLASQLLLYRQHKPKELPKLIQDYDREISASAILSADLILRFMPPLIQQLKLRDVEDKLINILEKILTKWHFSGINYELAGENLNFTPILNNPCLLQLYCNRIIQYKKDKFLTIPEIQQTIVANLGNYQNRFWRELNIYTKNGSN